VQCHLVVKGENREFGEGIGTAGDVQGSGRIVGRRCVGYQGPMGHCQIVPVRARKAFFRAVLHYSEKLGGFVVGNPKKPKGGSGSNWLSGVASVIEAVPGAVAGEG